MSKDLRFKNYDVRGFTLIELLVVIAIIAVIVAFAVTNFLGARERARDVKRKGELRQLKAALRLYYNDYQSYPTANNGFIYGCGANGDLVCPQSCTSGQFAAGGTDGCSISYMRELPEDYTYSRNPNKPLDSDDFLLRVNLDNQSDGDIARSQATCGFPVPTPGQYHVCSD